MAALAPLLEACSASWRGPVLVFGSTAACGAAEAAQACVAALVLALPAGTGEPDSLRHDRRQGTWPTPGAIREEILPPAADVFATRSTCAAGARAGDSALMNPPSRSVRAGNCVVHDSKGARRQNSGNRRRRKAVNCFSFQTWTKVCICAATVLLLQTVFAQGLIGVAKNKV